MVNATTITAVAPAGSAGAASVVVTTSGGSNSANTLYTYSSGPTVSAISPSSGPIAGGTSVTITGANLTGATGVTIGGTAATSVVVVNATTITAVTPAGSAGAKSVVVTTSGGSNAANTLYTYTTIATSSVALTASTQAPVFGKSVTFTATVTPSAATGSVTFKDGATTLGTGVLSGGVATYSTSALKLGAHTITAVYAGNSSYAASTSNAVVVTTGRPDPTADPNVRGIIVSQVSATLRTAEQVSSTVQQRLETIHGDDTPAFSNGVGISVRERPTAMVSDPSEQDKALPSSKASKSRLMKDPANQPKPSKAPAGTLTPDYNVWTAGSVVVGNQTYTGQVADSRITVSGLTAGVDKRVSQNVKGGFAVSLSSDRTKGNNDGFSNNAKSVTGTAYASWRVSNNVFLDGLLGYGRLNFATSRYDGNAASTIYGSRSGSVAFGSVLASYEQKMGAFKFAPYAGIDLMLGTLDAYTETGDADWTLRYASASVTSQGLILGFRGQYDMSLSSGTLSPMARVQFRYGSSGSVNQSMSYAADSSTSYNLAVSGAQQNTLATSLGLRFTSKSGPAGQIEYLNNASVSGRQSNGIRGMVMIPF